MKVVSTLLSSLLLAIALPFAQANSTPLADNVGDFVPTYGGPHGADLDVVSTEVRLTDSNFYFSATMNGAIGTTASGFYIWGLDRGSGATTANFASLGLPGIIFDSILRVNQDGSGQVTTLGAGGVTTLFGAGSFAIDGNSFAAVIPASLLPSRGFALEQYTQNLWPRFGGAVAPGQTQIADFAPDASMAAVTVPEPASLALWSVGLLALGFARLRKHVEEK